MTPVVHRKGTFDQGAFDAYWAKFHVDDNVQFIRPSGNPMGKDLWAQMMQSEDVVSESARRSSAEHLIATKALRCTATARMLIVAQCSANP